MSLDTHSFEEDGRCLICGLTVDLDHLPRNAPPCKTRVVNGAYHRYDVYIGRGRHSRWGSPFVIGRDGTRDEVIDKYAAWIQTQPALLAALPTLRGKVLGCWCAPQRCHGDVLAALADAPPWPTTVAEAPTTTSPPACQTDVVSPSPMVDRDPTLIIIDTETTGINRLTDQVIELAIQFGFEREDGTTDALVWRFDPMVDIDPGAEAVHGISKAMLAGCPRFAEHAQEILGHLGAASVIVGYNLDFDLAMLAAEFERLKLRLPQLTGKSLIDPLALWRVAEPRTLASAHRRFVGREFENAHEAKADIAATSRVLLGMLDAFKQDGKFWDEIADFIAPDRAAWLGFTSHFVWQEGRVVFGFGKHKGADVRGPGVGGYLKWMGQGADFPPHVREIARAAAQARNDTIFLNWCAQAYPPPPPTAPVETP